MSLLLAIPLIQTQGRLKVLPMKTELGKANAKLAESEEKARNAETEQAKLQSSLDQANAEIERLKTELQQQTVIPPEQGNSVSE